jgi:hypothetical protein
MNDEANADAEAAQSHGCTLLRGFVFLAMIVALAFALHLMFSPRPRVIS